MKPALPAGRPVSYERNSPLASVPSEPHLLLARAAFSLGERMETAPLFAAEGTACMSIEAQSHNTISHADQKKSRERLIIIPTQDF